MQGLAGFFFRVFHKSITFYPQVYTQETSVFCEKNYCGSHNNQIRSIAIKNLT